MTGGSPKIDWYFPHKNKNARKFCSFSAFGFQLGLVVPCVCALTVLVLFLLFVCFVFGSGSGPAAGFCFLSGVGLAEHS